MKYNLRRLFNSSIVSRMTILLVLIELAILLLVVALSVFVLLPRLQSNGIHNMEKVMNSLQAQIESRLNDYTNYTRFLMNNEKVENALRDYQTNPEKQTYNRICLFLTESLSSTNLIRGVQLEDEDGTVFRSVINLRPRDYDQLDESWHQDVWERKKWESFSPIYDPGLNPKVNSIAYSGIYHVGSRLYVLTLFFNCSNLVSIMETGAADFDGLVVTDFLHTPFYERGDISHAYDMADKVLLPQITHSRDSSGTYFFRLVKASGWRLVGYLSDQSLLQNYWSIFFAGILLSIIFCLLTLAFSIPALNLQIRPVHNLSRTMEQVSRGELKAIAKVEREDEIGNLSRIFNEMLESLNRHLDEEIEFHRREDRMRYNLLLAQIDSHLIGNTMSTMNSLIRKGRGDDAIRLNTALLKIIQNNLRIRELDNTDTLAHEMEMVQQYWLIMKVRKENHVELIWEIPGELMEHNIPKNIIQPLVENCIFHGLVDEETGELNGEIRISAFENGKSLCITVRDNGRGMDGETLERVNRSPALPAENQERGEHIGMSNIKHRLYAIYQQDCMKISCDNGTTVTMCIPL